MQITDDMLYQHAPEVRDLWLSTLPSDADIPEHKFSRRFERKMKRLIREQRRSPQVNRVIRGLRRVAAIILVIGILSFSGLMTVEAYREKVIEVISQVFHDLTNYRFISEESNLEQYVELPEITFQYIPDEMEKIEDTARERYRYILYEAQDGNFFELTQTVIVDNSDYEKILDTEGAISEEFYIGDSEAVLNTKNGVTSIFWTKDHILYSLYGTIDPTELKAVAEKIN